MRKKAQSSSGGAKYVPLECLAKDLRTAKTLLERHFRDVCELEFTVEEGKFNVVGARPARRSPLAAVRFALQLLAEGIIEPEEVFERVRPSDIAAFLPAGILNRSSLREAGRGLGASRGVGTGQAALTIEHGRALAAAKQPFVLIRPEISSAEERDAVHLSEGVIATRGGMTSHAAIVSRACEKPCVVGFSARPAGDLCEGEWVTIDGTNGVVFRGRAQCQATDWRNVPELVTLAELVDLAIRYKRMPPNRVGAFWRMADFFHHRTPLSKRGITRKQPVQRSGFVAFETPRAQTLDNIRKRLQPISDKDYDPREILLSLVDALSRQLASVVGIGKHSRYFRPLFDPMTTIKREGAQETQLIGMEFFGINRHLPHMVDLATVTLFVAIDCTHGGAWFLDHTNPEGESFVVASESVCGFALLVNDAWVDAADLPSFYNAIRRRELVWDYYDRHEISYEHVVAAASEYGAGRARSARALQCCLELGLVQAGSLTAVGESLLGRATRRASDGLSFFE